MVPILFNRLKKSVSFVVRYNYIIIGLLLVLMGIATFQTIQKLKIDNALSIWFLENDPSYKAYIDFQQQYGSDEIFIGMLLVENALDTTVMARLKGLTHAIERLPFVKTSFSLAKAKYPIPVGKTVLFKDLYSPKRSENNLKKLYAQWPNVTAQLVTEDYKNLFFYIQLKPTPTIETQRRGIAKEIRNTIQKYFKDYRLTGPPVLNEAYNKGIFKESLWFGILTVLVITLMLVFLLPSKKYLFIALFSVGVPIGLLFGIITSLGYSLNMISMLIPTILMVYSVSDGVHIINIFHNQWLQNPKQNRISLIVTTLKKSFIPCFYTTLTTFVGYFALYLSPLPAFKNMGLLTCLGLLLSYILVYIIAIIGFSKVSLNIKKEVAKASITPPSKFISWLNTFTSQKKNILITAFSLLLLFGGYSIFKVKLDTDSLDLLAAGSAKEDLQSVEDKLKGSSRLQLNISTSLKETMASKNAIAQMEVFQNKLEAHSKIIAPVSAVNIKSFIEKRNPVALQGNIPETQIKQVLSVLDAPENSFFKLFSKDLSTAVITLSMPQMKTSTLSKLLTDIKLAFGESFAVQDYTLTINGFAVVFATLNAFILETQLKSFFAAFIAAFLCLLFFIKRVKTTLLVLIPNVLPLAVLAILMYLFEIPLDVTTAMITPIMLGIAMDDTIHLVFNYKNKAHIATPSQRINSAMHYTAHALIATTIALVAGFLIIASSAVPSVSSFGILCAVTVATALITDLFYLPALLKKFDT